MKYTRSRNPAAGIMDVESRDVFSFEGGKAIQFRCPCGRRLVYVTAPPHGITFDDAGHLTLDGSVGSVARPATPLRPARQQNWCHFFIRDGDPEMCDDAQCPGGHGQA